MEKNDFVYEKWLEREPLNPKIGKLPDNVELHECAKAFVSNMGRVEALARLPHILISLGISKGHADVLAKAQQKNVNDIHKILRTEAKWLEGVGTDAKHLANQAANSTVPMVRTAHQALVAASVMMSYGALENLMIDLRTIALEARPELASKTSKKLLGRRNLRDLRTTYETMFGKESHDPPHQLSKEFASFYEGLLVLEAVRNLFAHRSGIVDERFVERVETAPALKGLKIGEELFVDFAIARALAGVARDFGVYLVRFVDWWLNTHPHSER
jgi:hypothetical protein